MNETFWDDLKTGHFIPMVKEASKGESLTNSQEVYNVMKPLFAETDDIESLHCIFLDAKNKIIAIEKMFSGTITSSAVYPREIIKRLLLLKSTAIIMVHNHPSGCIEPSPEDSSITLKVGIALSSIDATLHDHIIVGNGYFSMADKRLLQQFRKHYENFISSNIKE